MKPRRLTILLACPFACLGHAQDGTRERNEGWSGVFLNSVTLQKDAEDALRSRPSPYRSNRVTDTGGDLLNLAVLQFRSRDWTFMGSYTDNRTVSGNGAYSLTNPLTFGVNTVETTGTTHKAVEFKAGLHELAATFRGNGTMVMMGKIDTSNWYLADPTFGGDLNHGMDYGNAANHRFDPRWAGFGRVSYAKGDHTFVSELTLNFKVHPRVVAGVAYDLYTSSGNALLAKDGGWNGARRNHIASLRVTSFLPF